MCILAELQAAAQTISDLTSQAASARRNMNANLVASQQKAAEVEAAHQEAISQLQNQLESQSRQHEQTQADLIQQASDAAAQAQERATTDIERRASDAALQQKLLDLEARLQAAAADKAASADAESALRGQLHARTTDLQRLTEQQVSIYNISLV